MTYTIKSGDTLSSIAQAQMGDGRRWPEIYAANYPAIAKAQRLEARILRRMQGPNWIFPGTVIQMPHEKHCRSQALHRQEFH